MLVERALLAGSCLFPNCRVAIGRREPAAWPRVGARTTVIGSGLRLAGYPSSAGFLRTAAPGRGSTTQIGVDDWGLPQHHRRGHAALRAARRIMLAGCRRHECRHWTAPDMVPPVRPRISCAVAGEGRPAIEGVGRVGRKPERWSQSYVSQCPRRPPLRTVASQRRRFDDQRILVDRRDA